MIRKNRRQWPRQRQNRYRTFRFDILKLQLPIPSVHCSPDDHPPLVEVDVRPFEPECLIPPQTHRQRNRPQCIQSVLFCGL
jgi:hypothetical protein